MEVNAALVNLVFFSMPAAFNKKIWNFSMPEAYD
jgi:hypothetical protein